MVWFHGGAYSSGTSNEIETDGERLSRKGDVVVVTVNHRLNAFGYLYLAEFGSRRSRRFRQCWPARSDPGPRVGARQRRGIWRRCRQRDDLRALRRRREERRADGDAEGEGLFHRVTTHSGQQITASRRETATGHALALLKALGLDRSQSRSASDAADGAARQGQPRARLSRTGQGWTLAPARSIRSRCAAAVGAHSDDPRQHERRDADAHRPRRSVALLVDVGDAEAEARSQLAVHGQPRSRRCHREVSRVASGVFAGRRLLRGDDGLAIVARPGDRGRSPRRAAGRRSADVCVPVRLADADRRRQVGRASRARRAVHFRQRGDHAAFRRHRRRTAGAGRPDEQRVDRVRAVRQSECERPAGVAGLRSHRRATMVFNRESRVVDDPRGRERRLFGQVPYVQPGT